MGRFIGILHGVAKLHGKKLDAIFGGEKSARAARSVRHHHCTHFVQIRRQSNSCPRVRFSLYALGIPPAQYDALVGNGSAIAVFAGAGRTPGLRFSNQGQLFRLAGLWPGLRSGIAGKRCRIICAPKITTASRRGWTRVSVHHDSLSDFLGKQPAQSFHRYVHALDAQDWMSAAQLESVVAPDRSHRRFPRCQSDLPHRRLQIPPRRGLCSRETAGATGSITNGRAGCCMPRTAPPSMGAFISMSAAPSAEAAPGDHAGADG